ncbi:uncharacterized protein PG986_011278 [Apiospora aurea]|uniref:Uncharacterized protein n=1 Tax=Apiospora aurea TaxID=335848 RepID=A0ABR1Q4U6_9PEZI
MASASIAGTATAADFDIDKYIMLDGEMTGSSQQNTDSKGLASNAPSTGCDVCESLEMKCFIWDDLPNTCTLCGQSCTAVDLESIIPEIPREIRSITTRMPNFCQTCVTKRDPAELYRRLRPALDDNDFEIGSNSVAVEYVAMGCVVDHGFLQVIYPDQGFKPSQHREVKSLEIVGKDLGPEERRKVAKASPVSKINKMAEMAEQLAAGKRQRMQERRQKKYTKRLRAFRQKQMA